MSFLTKTCFGCKLRVSRWEATRTAYTDCYNRITTHRDGLWWCPTCAPAYERAVLNRRGRCVYYREIECDQSGFPVQEG